MRLSILPLACLVLANGVVASPFVKGPGERGAQYIYSEGLTRNIVGQNGKIIEGANSEGSGPSYDILTTSHTLMTTYGLPDAMDVSLGFTFKSVDGEKKDFQGITDIMLKWKYMFGVWTPFYTGVSLGYHNPGKDYETNSIDAPGTHSQSVPLSLSAAYYEPENFPLMAGVDLTYDYREDDVPDQTKLRFDLYYVHPRFSLGGFYGMVESLDGIPLDPKDPEWQKAVKKNKGKQPFHRLDEKYNFVGGSLYGNLDKGSIGISYSEKLLKGMRNSDINSNVSFILGYTF